MLQQPELRTEKLFLSRTTVPVASFRRLPDTRLKPPTSDLAARRTGKRGPDAATSCIDGDP